jgi:putative dehydrogenase
MRQKNPPVLSATTTLVKDLGIVLSTAKGANCPVFLAAAAHQQFIRAAAHGWEGEDDACVGRLWEFMGVSIRDFD